MTEIEEIQEIWISNNLPVEKDDEIEIYEKLREILSPSIGIPLPKGELSDKLLHNMFTPEEAYIVAKGVKRALIPSTAGMIRRRLGIPKKEKENLNKILQDMRYKAKIIDKWGFYVMPPYLPGLFEVYFTENRDDPVKMKAAGEAHFELIKKGFHVKHSQGVKTLFRVIPAAEPSLKTYELNKSIDVKHQVYPFEVLEKYLSKYDRFAVQPCSCRSAANYAEEPCKRTKENFCVSAGLLADMVIEHEVGREVNFEEILEIMKRAEKEGLVHESANMQKAFFFMCNCCSCCCGFLKSIKELDNKGAVLISNFEPEINFEKCNNCGLCIKKCPMEALQQEEDSIIFNKEDCIGCGVCASNCSQEAITLKKVRNIKPSKSMLSFSVGFLKSVRKFKKILKISANTN